MEFLGERQAGSHGVHAHTKTRENHVIFIGKSTTTGGIFSIINKPVNKPVGLPEATIMMI